jgi:outer membrane murein-binding lipoprotein Lpp
MNAVNGAPGKWTTVNITVAALAALSVTLTIVSGTVSFIAGAMTASQNIAEYRTHVDLLQRDVAALTNKVTAIEGDTRRIREDVSEMRMKK